MTDSGRVCWRRCVPRLPGLRLYFRTERALGWRSITKAYDRINLTVPKGQKDLIQAHAEAQGESTNGFINRAISETMERDKNR